MFFVWRRGSHPSLITILKQLRASHILYTRKALSEQETLRILASSLDVLYEVKMASLVPFSVQFNVAGAMSMGFALASSSVDARAQKAELQLVKVLGLTRKQYTCVQAHWVNAYAPTSFSNHVGHK